MDKYGEQLQRAKQSPEYLAAALTNEFAVQVHERMKRLGISQAELARRIGHTRAYVSQLLRGDSNFTALTMAKVAMALGESVVEISLRPKSKVWEGESSWQPTSEVDRPSLLWRRSTLTVPSTAVNDDARLAAAA